ncbi:MAG: hypothetical protein ACE1ZQ_09375 [Ignavibacteriaceae bacterium]
MEGIKDKVIQIRVSSRIYEIIKQAATNDGSKVAGYVRTATFRRLKQNDKI